MNNLVGQGAGSRIFDVANYTFLACLLFLTLYPFYYVAIVSISGGEAIARGEVTWWPTDVNFEAYKLILQDDSILVAYRNTILYTVTGTLISLAMTTLCAYPLSRKRLVFRRPFMWLIVFTMMFRGGIIPTYLLVQSLGMLDTIWAIVLPLAIGVWYMVIMRTFFMALPDSLEESAYIDGANDFQILLRVILPLSKAIIATLIVFYSVQHWNSFFPALIYLTSEDKFPLQIILRNIVIAGDISQQQSGIGIGSGFMVVEKTIKYAVIMITTLPIMMVYPFLQKHFVKGVLIGSIKG